jgi:hypothetical protein
MTRAPIRGLCAAALFLIAPGVSFGHAFAAGESALTVADLAAYRAALSLSERNGAPSQSERPSAVGFRELWDHPRTYQGHRVQVQGRLVRRFRQGAFGTFPPLEEAWIFSPGGDPFCLVFPAAETEPKMKNADSEAPVRFAGTFLKLLEYQARDGPRLAPLIVGPTPPRAVVPAASRTMEPDQSAGRSSSPRWLEGTIALALALLVAVVLVSQHLRRPVQRPLRLGAVVERAPMFNDAPVPGRSDEEKQDEEGGDACPT